MTHPSEFDIPTFFHTILFAYQKKLKDILGPGGAIFVHPVLDTISLIEREKGFNLIKGETLDEIFENFAKELKKTGIVKEVSFKKLGPERYVFNVDECCFCRTRPRLAKTNGCSLPLRAHSHGYFPVSDRKESEEYKITFYSSWH